MTAVTRPALRYYGGKWVMAPWIIAHFPAHEVYVEPYAGAASVLLRKPLSPIEVYNDLDGEVVNFWRMLRERTDDLVRAVALTPYSRAELKAAAEPTDDPLERARRLFVLSWQGRSRNSWSAGWRFARSRQGRHWTPADDWADAERLYAIADRLSHVQVECSPALDVIERFDTPDALFYCDPPYVAETRSGRWAENAYAFEMSDDDHRELAEVLAGIEGMAIVSGYESDLYAEIYDGWTVEKRIATTDHRGSQRFATECLWLSPRTAAAVPQLSFELA